MKKVFKIFIDSLDVLDELSDEQAGQLFKAIRAYEVSGEEVLSGLMKAVFTPFKNNSDRATAAYNAVCEANKANGIKGGRPKSENNPMGLKLTEQKPKNPKEEEEDLEEEQEKKNKSIACRLENLPNDKKSELYAFMLSHCQENGIDRIEIEKFKDHWVSKSGKDATKKDWYATFRNWCRSDWVKKTSNDLQTNGYGIDTGGYSL